MKKTTYSIYNVKAQPKEDFCGSTEFNNQNLRKIGEGTVNSGLFQVPGRLLTSKLYVQYKYRLCKANRDGTVHQINLFYSEIKWKGRYDRT